MSFSPHEVYSRCLLGIRGYPLWTPQLKAQLCESYQVEGLKIGDVGIISPIDGSFDVLFNITLPRNRQPYPRLVRAHFTPIVLDPEADFATQADAVSTHGVISSPSVEVVSQDIHICNQKPPTADYEFGLSTEEGGILVLPEGAESCDLANENRFLAEAISHGIDWYQCATEEAGRLINDDSLYLVTGFHKAHSWSLGAAAQVPSGAHIERSVRFRVGQLQDDVTARAYVWTATTRAFEKRVGPAYPYEIPNYIPDQRLRRGVNQTVFVRGFRITVNRVLLLFKTVTVETRQGTFGGVGSFLKKLLWRGTSDSTPSSGAESPTDNTAEQDFSVNHRRLHTDNHITIDRMSDVSQTFHPGDTINQYLLKREPRAMVAVTHDSLWIEILQMGLLKLEDFSREQCLENILSKYYRVIVEEGAVYLQKGPLHGHFVSESLFATATGSIGTPGASNAHSHSKGQQQAKEQTLVPGDPPPPYTTALPALSSDTAKPWSRYPQDRLSNGTDQVLRSRMLTVCEDQFTCQIYKVNVLMDGVFDRFGEVPSKIPSDESSTKRFWDDLRSPMANGPFRVQALFVENMTYNVLQILGTRFNIEPFFFTSSASWSPSWYREDLRGAGDHITVILPFIHTAYTVNERQEKHSLPPQHNKKQAIEARVPLVLSDKKSLVHDLLAIHMVRSVEENIIISYHHSRPQGTTAKQLQSFVQRTGDSAHWQKIYRETKDSTFILLAILWYALYAWDETLEVLNGHLDELLFMQESMTHISRILELEKLQAHLERYQQLLQDFRHSVEFVGNTPNPAMLHESLSHDDRKISKQLLEWESNRLLGEIERVDGRRKVQMDRITDSLNKIVKDVAATSTTNDPYREISHLVTPLLCLFFGIILNDIDFGSFVKSFVKHIELACRLALFTAWILIAMQEHSSFHPGGHHVVQRIAWPVFAIYRLTVKVALAIQQRVVQRDPPMHSPGLPLPISHAGSATA